MKILCLNIDSEKEQWALTKAECERVGFTEVQRFSAITGDNRPLAFNQSVLAAMKSCLIWQEGDNCEYEELLLIEDDCAFDPNTTRDKLAEICRSEIPWDYLTVHFGANITGWDWKMPERHSANTALLHNCWMSHCTLYSGDAIRLILEGLKSDVLTEENCIFDEWLRRNILPLDKSYLLTPMVAYQRPRQSYIWGRHADYTQIHANGNAWLSDNL